VKLFPDLILWFTIVGALALIAYVYVGYPLALAALRLLQGEKGTRVADIQPPVTLIIPAYNEAKVLRPKLENALQIDYPSELLEIIVASDGSSDATDDIAREFADRGVKLRRFEPRSGKISVLNRTVPAAIGEIVVLCDANVMFWPDAVRRLVRHFADPQVGAVTGDVRIQSADAPFGQSEGMYYKYERLIQLQESAVGSVVGVDGGMYAIRREAFRPLPADTILDDFIISMNIAAQGWRVLYDPSAVATENATLDIRQEFRRKVRIVAGAFRELLRGQGLPRSGQLFWSYLSHKVMRWLIPWFLLALLLCTAILVWQHGWGSPAGILLLAQAGLYTGALVGSTRPNARWPAIIGIPFYFCLVNAAAWLGSLRGLLGLESVTWTKADR
jgi:cellulose synthase/poly-beta-1,6-N-acetylglucosamine synthase-like glycosyltransferase